MKTDIAVIVQCRISSKRLPEKALKMLGGRTVLEWTLLSMSKVKADRYFVATDENSYDLQKKVAEQSSQLKTVFETCYPQSLHM